MLEGKGHARATLDDKIKGLLLPFIIGGSSLGAYTGYVLSARVDAEIDARKAIERRLEVFEDRATRRIERLEDRLDRGIKR